MMKQAFLSVLVGTTAGMAGAFQLPPTRSTRASTTRQYATVQPSETSTIGTVGNGYLPILLAKLSALTHGSSWVICPAADMDMMKQLAAMDGFGELPKNLEFVPASDTDRVESLLRDTDALMVACDDVDSVVDPNVINYLLDPDKVSPKRVVAMSRNLNGSGMGMLVSASRRAANAQVWDNSNAAAYRSFEQNIKDASEKCGADWTIVRAGTLKGGACGEKNLYPQYLAESYYELTKNDIITWQLLFDCNIRGVKLQKGDVLPGPGVKAVFTATGSEEHEGDSSRAAVAEAMVRSLEIEDAANIDFGVGTVASRDFPAENRRSALILRCGLSRYERKRGLETRVAYYLVGMQNYATMFVPGLGTEAISVVSAGWVGWQNKRGLLTASKDNETMSYPHPLLWSS